MSSPEPNRTGIARFIPGLALVIGVELWIARANKPLRDLLLATGLTQRIGQDNIYPSIRAAVAAYHARFDTA